MIRLFSDSTQMVETIFVFSSRLFSLVSFLFAVNLF